jgi:hypothetical protein
MTISDSFGSIFFESTPLTAPPITLPASFLDYRVLFGMYLQGPSEGFTVGLLSSGLSGTVSSLTPVITFLNMLPPGYRPSVQQDIVVNGQLGLPMVPNGFIARFVTDGSIQLYKNAVFADWQAGDVFRLNSQTTIVLRITS